MFKCVANWFGGGTVEGCNMSVCCISCPKVETCDEKCNATYDKECEDRVESKE